MNRRAVDTVSEEIAQEKAEAFGRTARLLEQSLDALRGFDASGGDAAVRAELIERAAERVLHFIVQREACGLRDPDYVFRSFGVPRDVIARLGAARNRAATART
jgi:hypothetical protein